MSEPTPEQRVLIEAYLAAHGIDTSEPPLWRYALVSLRHWWRWKWNITIRRRRCQAPGCQRRARWLYGNPGWTWLCDGAACEDWWLALPVPHPPEVER
jgi:hypothetical protein